MSFTVERIDVPLECSSCDRKPKSLTEIQLDSEKYRRHKAIYLCDECLKALQQLLKYTNFLKG